MWNNFFLGEIKEMNMKKRKTLPVCKIFSCIARKRSSILTQTIKYDMILQMKLISSNSSHETTQLNKYFKYYAEDEFKFRKCLSLAFKSISLLYANMSTKHKGISSKLVETHLTHLAVVTLGTLKSSGRAKEGKKQEGIASWRKIKNL